MAWTLKWPLTFVVDHDGGGTGWAVVHSRLVSHERQEQFAALRRAGFRFLGMTSDATFPALDGPDFLDYGSLCEAWCHCFREPDRYLPAGVPRALLSASDFVDPVAVSPDVAKKHRAERHDFVYVGASEPWKKEAKSWALARACIPRLCDALGATALVVGVDETEPWPSVTFVPWLAHDEFLARLARARFLFLPNERDASPRVAAEALSLDVPIVVNRRIVGGWKYVNAFTGAFFDDENDVVAAARRCLETTGSPRAWFHAHHGRYRAGRSLLALVRSLDPAVEERSHLTLARRVDAPLASGA